MIEVPIRNIHGDRIAKVSDADADLARYLWYLAGGKVKAGTPGKYAARHVKGPDGRPRTILLHRIIAERMGLLETTEPESGQAGRWRISIDHENGDKLDCQRSNLRVRDRPGQMQNPNDALRATNRSGFRGVSFVKRRERYGKPWMAYVTVNYRTKNLGWFATAEEAAASRRQWDERNGGEQA